MVVLGLVVYGREYAQEETPHFFRSLFAHRCESTRFVSGRRDAKDAS
jgi:hypothetical protein